MNAVHQFCPRCGEICGPTCPFCPFTLYADHGKTVATDIDKDRVLVYHLRTAHEED